MTSFSGTASGVDERARSAVGSACTDVHDAGSADHVDGVQPALVARPGAVEEVAEVMRAAAAHGLAVVPRGRGTKLTWGRPPTRADLLLDLSGLDRVLDHAAGDLIVHAQAGARLEEVQRTVAGARQRLALDETVAGSTVGGALVAGTSGPGRVATGTLRDLLIGVKVVRADGVAAKAGGRVVKNVAGYDLGKLVHGSFGTLAVVTEALFRLHPLPAGRRFVSTAVAGPEHAHRLTQAVLGSPVVPGAVEVDIQPDGEGTLAVLLEGIEAGVLGRTSATLDLLGGGAIASADPPPGWGAYPWHPGATGDEREVALKLTFALSGLPDVLAAARGCPAPVRLRGSSGAGVLYAALPAGTEPGVVADVLAALRAVCTARGGAAVVLDAPAGVKDAVDTWGPVPALDLMRRVKDRFDPDRRLAPGRFVGGI